MIERVVKADGAGRVPVNSLPDNIPASKIAGLNQGLRPHTVDTNEPVGPNKGDLWTGSDSLTRYWDGSGWIVVQAQDPSASQGVDTLSTSLQLANDTIANHTRTLNTLSNSSTSAAASITTLQADMTGAQSEITQLKSSVNVATTDIANVENSLVTLTTTSGTHTTDIATLMAAKDVTTNSLDTLNTSMSSLTTRVTTVETKVADIESSLGGGTSLPALTSRVTTAEGEIDALQSDATNLTTRVSTAESEIDTLQTNATALTTRVTDAETAATVLTGRVDTAETTIASNTTAATTATTNAATAQAKADANETALTALTGRVTTAEGDIDTLETNVTNLTTTVNNLSNNTGSTGGGMPVYKAEDYGAVDSSQADCAVPIQAAIDAAATAGGGIVTLPAGQTLKVSSIELKTGVTLDGLTRRTTLRQVDYTDNHLIRITGSNMERAKVTRITINGRKGAQNAENAGIYHTNNNGSPGRYTQHIIEDVDVTSTKGPAIHLGVYSAGNVVRDVRVYDCSSVGIKVVSEESLVKNTYVGLCAGGGILVQRESNNFRDIIVEACGATGAAPSVKIEAQNTCFDGLHVMKSQGHDVMVHKQSTVIKGLRITNALLEGGNSADNGSVALWLQDTAGAQVQATVQNLAGYTPSHAQALYLYGSTAKTCNVALSVNDSITPLKGVTNPNDNFVVVNGQAPRPAADVMWSAATDARPTADASVMVIFTGVTPPADALAHDLHIIPSA